MKPYWLQVSNIKYELVDTDSVLGTVDIAIIRKTGNNKYDIYFRVFTDKNVYKDASEYYTTVGYLDKAKQIVEEKLHEYITRRDY